MATNNSTGAQAEKRSESKATSDSQFPADFLWGAATAAYQIEGAVGEDGRGSSIWDTFSHTPGAIERGENGDIATDHYHRWREDLALMVQLGLKAYRFSIAWPRILPQGQGSVNQAGLDFYDRLVDALLAENIVPFITLYHWDLPQALQDIQGGWLHRDTAYRFSEYADVVTRRLGDRVSHWLTLNEPYISMEHGYVSGGHAPGLQGLANALPVIHHLLLGHGLAIEPIRANAKAAQIGIAYSLRQILPATTHETDRIASERADAYMNRLCLDPTLKREYPHEIADLIPQGLVQDEDLAIIGRPVELVGVNYYQRLRARAAAPSRGADAAEGIGFEIEPPRTDAQDLTVMGWEAHPDGLAYWIERIAREYLGHDIYVTENGAAYPDTLTPDGAVHDARRSAFLRDHLQAACATLATGALLKGYFAWSLVDNFEWAKGYSPRFGLIYNEFATQTRVIKDSGHWYARLIASGNLDVPTD
jgi:beta-glucosidase